MEIKRVPIESLKLDEKNPRFHGERNMDAIKKSLEGFGQAEPLIVQKSTSRVIGGNGRLMAMRSIGWTECDIVELDVNDLVATALAVALNKTAELAEWDRGFLGESLKLLSDQKFDLSITGFEPKEFQPLIDAAAFGQEHGGGQVNDPGALEPPREAVSRRGDLWLLGAHRLLCGDSTDGGDVAIVMNGEKAGLMNTDPPYGVDYAKIKSGVYDVKQGSIENDDLTTGPELQAFLESAIRAALPHLTANPAFYLWHPMLTQGTFFAAAAAAAADILIHRQIIWVKPHLVLTRSGQYHWRHELCFYGWIRGEPCPWYGDKSQTSVWMVGESTHGREHATQKPVALFEPPLLNHTREGDVCYEPFSGSGSQIIAAEKLARRCYAIEIEPRYIDVALRRWERATGKAATLESTGRSYAETAAERGVKIDPEPAKATPAEPAKATP